MRATVSSFAHDQEQNLIAVLKRCSQTKDFRCAQRLLAYIQDNNLISQSKEALGSYLVCALVVCGCMPDAQEVFDGLLHKDERAWTTLISGYNVSGESEHAVQLYRTMEELHVEPSRFTFVAVLKSLARLKDLEGGRLLHIDVISRGVNSDFFIESTLVDMYGKCGSFADARTVLDKLVARDVVNWNALISDYTEHGFGDIALECFEEMKADNVAPNVTTFACILKAAGSICAIERGCLVCVELNKLGLEGDLFIGNAMVDMYGKCGYLIDACQVFKKLRVKDVVSWNVLIAGYAEHGFHNEALSCFNEMEQEDVSPTDVTFACMLNACATAGALESGQGLLSLIIKRGLENDFFIGSSIVDMYAKCGALGDGWNVFNKLALRDVVSWTLMIKRFGENQEGVMAVECFKEMQKLDVKPNAITFTCLLAACSHESLVHEGQLYFELMREEHAIEPTMEHYGCMVDLFARAGCVYEATKFAGAVCCFPSQEILTALLTAAKNHGRVKLGERCFQQLVRADEENATAEVLMGDLYAGAEMWNEVKRIGARMINF